MLAARSRFPIRQMLTVGLLPSSLKIWWYRLNGARIAPRVSIGLGSVVLADEIEIGEGATIGFGVYLRARKVKIGRFARIGSASFLDADTITIGEDAKISEQVFVGGLSSPSSHFRLGARTILMQHTFVNVARPVTIGDDTGIGGKCTIFTHSSWQNMLDGYPVVFAPVTIGNNVWIPWQVFVMPGVTIGDGATIGAGSLVTKDVPAGALAVGAPAKVIREPDQYPARPSLSEQKGMLRSIIAEFCEHLEHEGLNLRSVEDTQREGQIITVWDKTMKPDTLFVNWNHADGNQASEAKVVLSFEAISEEGRRVMEESRQMWLDLGRKQRGGPSHPLGEELANFLKRYGVRFQRTC